MALQALLKREKTYFTVAVLLAYLAREVICETGDCRQEEFRDQSGNCVPCKQCGPGLELSKECGFGYGEDAQCVTCRPHRFKEDRGFQKCKPCLDCAVANRFLKANCSVTRDAVCGDCLPGFYRKTKLVGFQDMECVPCGDPPPPYEPHCTSKVNLVKIPSTASSPRDTALAAVICSALATVLLALLILCVIYCKRQFMEKKPSWSLRARDIPYSGSELSCFDRPQLSESAPRACCRCHRDAAQTCGPVHLIPSLCCDDACSTDPVTLGCGVRSKATLQDRHAGPVGEATPAFFGSLSRRACGDCADARPLVQGPTCGDAISLCDSYAELTGGDPQSPPPDSESASSSGSHSRQDLVGGGAAPFPAPPGRFTATTDLSRRSGSATEPARSRGTAAPGRQPGRKGDDTLNPAARASLQEA